MDVSAMIEGIRFIARIGDGGIAEVWKADWQGQEVAVKLLREPGKVNLRRRFLREGRILRRLSHPNLVRCLAVIEGEHPALVLELLQGASLDQVVRHTPLAGERVERLGRELLRVLMWLHDQGIVHRDLKASNIWLAEDRVVLLDLGLAIDPSDPLTSTLGEVVGTHAYMAPEQLAGAAVDVRADLYSLGITLYEALCGQRPYVAKGLEGYRQAHRSGRAIPIAHRGAPVDPGFAALVDRMLARDPADRPATAGIALALINAGVKGAVRTVGSPRWPVGRDALRGAVVGAIDGTAEGAGGWIHAWGAVGCGLGAAAAHARGWAEEEGAEHLTIRAGGPRAVLGRLASALQAWTDQVPAEWSMVLSALVNLAREGRGRILLIVEGYDAPQAWIEKLRGLPELAVLTLGYCALPGALLLRPLTLSETGEVISQMLGTPALPQGLAEAVFHAARGESGRVTAVVRRIAAAGGLTCVGVLDNGDPAWVWDRRVRPAPSANALRRWRRALRRLSPAGLRMVDALQAGPQDAATLERVSAASPGEVYTLARLGVLRLEGNFARLSTTLRPVAEVAVRSETVWERLPQIAVAEALEFFEGFRDGVRPDGVLLAESDLLLDLGRPLSRRMIEALRTLGEGVAAERNYVLGRLAAVHGDVSAARRRLGRAMELGQGRVVRYAATGLAELELQMGRRADGHHRARELLAAELDDELRCRLCVRSAAAEARVLRFELAARHMGAAAAVGPSRVGSLLELGHVDIELRAGAFLAAELRLRRLSRVDDDDELWALRAWYFALLARLRRAQRDLAAAHAVHVKAAEIARRGEDVVWAEYHAGLAAVLSGDVRAGTTHAAAIDSGIGIDLRAELLTACARRARDARLYQLAEATARSCGDKSLLLRLLFSLRGEGAQAEAAEIVSLAMRELHGPLRASFVDLPEVQWARG